MGLLKDVRHRARPALAPFLVAFAIVYFGFHFVQGERGLIAWLRYNQQIESASAQLAAVRAEREALEHRVSLLRPDRIDPDLLDERVREVLGLVRKDEAVVYAPTPVGRPIN